MLQFLPFFSDISCKVKSHNDVKRTVHIFDKFFKNNFPKNHPTCKVGLLRECGKLADLFSGGQGQGC